MGNGPLNERTPKTVQSPRLHPNLCNRASIRVWVFKPTSTCPSRPVRVAEPVRRSLCPCLSPSLRIPMCARKTAQPSPRIRVSIRVCAPESSKVHASPSLFPNKTMRSLARAVTLPIPGFRKAAAAACAASAPRSAPPRDVVSASGRAAHRRAFIMAAGVHAAASRPAAPHVCRKSFGLRAVARRRAPPGAPHPWDCSNPVAIPLPGWLP